jgi:hypothetical protein
LLMTYCPSSVIVYLQHMPLLSRTSSGAACSISAGSPLPPRVTGAPGCRTYSPVAVLEHSELSIFLFLYILSYEIADRTF